MSSIVNIEYIPDDELGSTPDNILAIGDWFILTDIEKHIEYVCVVALIDGTQFTVINICAKPEPEQNCMETENLFPIKEFVGMNLKSNSIDKQLSLGDINHITTKDNKIRYICRKINVDINIFYKTGQTDTPKPSPFHASGYTENLLKLRDGDDNIFGIPKQYWRIYQPDDK